jgi:pyrroline-5-carboxylate reductase
VNLLEPGALMPVADVVVLAVKPQALDSVASALSASVTEQTLLISVLAGKTILDIKARAPRVRAVVRAMPNTPAAVQRGISGCAASAEVSPDQRRVATRLLSAIGQVVWVEGEHLIDAVTAVSGSGPAYVFHLVEALASAGVAAGLPAATAMQLARATVEGAGELLFRQPEVTAEQLRRNVTSPGGTTEAALSVLMDEHMGLPPLMAKAVEAARRRGQELAG